MIEDRRQHPRLIPDSALLVSLGRSRRGFLFDLSEGGLAFDGFLPHRLEQVIPLAFHDYRTAAAPSKHLERWCGQMIRDIEPESGSSNLPILRANDCAKWISTRVFTIGEVSPAENLTTSPLRQERAAETNEFILQEPGDKKDAEGLDISVVCRSARD